MRRHPHSGNDEHRSRDFPSTLIAPLKFAPTPPSDDPRHRQSFGNRLVMAQAGMPGMPAHPVFLQAKSAATRPTTMPALRPADAIRLTPVLAHLNRSPSANGLQMVMTGNDRQNRRAPERMRPILGRKCLPLCLLAPAPAILSFRRRELVFAQMIVAPKLPSAMGQQPRAR